MLLVETDNILVRQFKPEDYSAYCALWDDGQVRLNFRVDDELADKWKESKRFDQICSSPLPNEFAIVTTDNNTVIGRAQFGNAVDFGSLSGKDFEVMIALMASARGHGLGQESTGALVEYLCAQQQAKRIFAKVMPNNSRSRDMAMRLGFAKVADVRSSRDPESTVFVLERNVWNQSQARARLLA